MGRKVGRKVDNVVNSTNHHQSNRSQKSGFLKKPGFLRIALITATYLLTSIIGLIAFLYPFWLPQMQQSYNSGMAHANDAPLLLSVLVGLCFAVLLLEVQGQSLNVKTVALLGVLTAMNAALRFAEAAIPGPGGFSPIFVLVVLTGYVFGGRFGFLLGALTILVSGLITGGVGPWLPYQMLAAGWIGLGAPLCRLILGPTTGLTQRAQERIETMLLAGYGGLCGLLFGAMMNLWFWPYAIGPADQYWQPGAGLWETILRFGLFYVTTSLIWDITRLVGNMMLILAFGAPILRVLRRFQRRFDFNYAPEAAAPIFVPTALRAPLPRLPISQTAENR